MITQRKTSRRREFLKTVTAAVAVPTIIRSTAVGLAGTVASSNRITMGLMPSMWPHRIIGM